MHQGLVTNGQLIALDGIGKIGRDSLAKIAKIALQPERWQCSSHNGDTLHESFRRSRKFLERLDLNREDVVSLECSEVSPYYRGG